MPPPPRRRGSKIQRPVRSVHLEAEVRACAGRGHSMRLGVLLSAKHKVDPNTSSCQGDTALTRAAKFGELESMRLLVQHGAMINKPSRDSTKRTPLLWACQHGQLNVVKELLPKHSEVLSTSDPLTRMKRGEHRRHRKALPVLATAINDVDAQGRTPLMLSSWWGHSDVVLHLVTVGAAVEPAERMRGWTALHGACLFGQTSAVRILLRAGAPIDATCYRGATPLFWACGAGNTAVVEVLLNAGSNASLVDMHGNTPLLSASARGHTECVRLLLLHFKRLGLPNDDDVDFASGGTIAECRTSTPLTKALLHVNEHGDNAIELARQEGQSTTLSTLRESTFDIYSSLDYDIARRTSHRVSRW